MIKNILENKIIQSCLSAIFIIGAIFVVYTPEFLIIKWGANHAVKIMFLYLIFGLFFLAANQKRLLFVSLICAAAIAIFLKITTNSEMKAPEKTKDALSIKLAHFNINNANEEFTSVVGTILSTNADLVSIQEITPYWNKILTVELDSIYPYYYTKPSLDLFGMAIYSKYPFIEVDTFHHQNIPNIIGSINLDNESSSVHFISSHTLPALNYNYYKQLKNHLNRIADHCNSINGPILAFGDYHTVPWSDEIQAFRNKTRLDDSRKGFTPTFPDGLSTIFEVPIDHIFFSSDFKCLGFSTISTIHTNHLGIQGTFELQFKEEQND